MIIHREIRSSYNHKPKVQGVDYSPFIMETVVLMETSGGGMEEWWDTVVLLGTPRGRYDVAQSKFSLDLNKPRLSNQ